MWREHGRLLPDVGVYPQVDGHHDQEHHQVGDGPEDQVAAAEDGGQRGAEVQAADAVPAQTGHQPHQDGDAPHRHDQQRHTPLRQVTVHLERTTQAERKNALLFRKENYSVQLHKI